MKRNPNKNVQNFCARRLLRGDLHEAALLAQKTGADFSLYETNTLSEVITSGEGWCCTEKGEIVAMGGFLPITAVCELNEAVLKTRLLQKRTILVLPTCAKAGYNGDGRFFEWCLSRAACKNEVLIALLPVKSGEKLLQLYFSCSLCIVAMRPLHNLRPYYFFARGGMQVNRTNSIIVNVSDTHLLSKLFENGYCAIDVSESDGEQKMELVPYNI